MTLSDAAERVEALWNAARAKGPILVGLLCDAAEPIGHFFHIHKDALSGIQSAITIVALVVGAWWSYRAFIQGRTSYPRIDMTHEVSHRPVYDGFALLHVDAKLKNNGSVLARFRRRSGRVWVHQVLPIHDCISGEVDGHMRASGNREAAPEIRWPLLAEMYWPTGRQCEVEPGETEQVDFDIIIPMVETVRVLIYCRNERKHFRVWWFGPVPYWIWRTELGWRSHGLYDLVRRHDDDQATVEGAS